MKFAISAVCTLAMAMTISACTVKASGGGGSPTLVPLGGGGSKDKGIAGPNIDGEWLSQCRDAGFGEFKILHVTYSKGALTRESATYSDSACMTQTSHKIEHGTFKFITAEKDGGYDMEYAIDEGNGVTALPQEKVILEGETLYLGDYAIGDALTRDMMVPLTRKGENPNPPMPPPPAGTCDKFAGKYQINETYYELRQTACTELDWLIYDVNDFSHPRQLTYIMDGMPHMVGDYNVKAYYGPRSLNFEYQTKSGHAQKEVWTMTKTPCDLANPDGGVYLMDNIYVDGSADSAQCDFYDQNDF